MTQPGQAESALRRAVEASARQREVAQETTREALAAREQGIEGPDTDREPQ